MPLSCTFTGCVVHDDDDDEDDDGDDDFIEHSLGLRADISRRILCAGAFSAAVA